MKKLVIVNLCGVGVMLLLCVLMLWLLIWVAHTPFQQGQCIGGLIVCCMCVGVWLALLWQSWEKL